MPAPHGIPFREAARTWLRIGLESFGGPAGQIAVMHRILVEEKRWISERRFLHALNYCMLLPGPEAMQLATYVGWLLHRVPGGLVAGTLFVLPGALLMLALAAVYLTWRDVTVIEGLFFGLKPAVLAVVIEAVLRIGKRSLGNGALATLAAASFIAIFFFAVPFPVLVAGAALAGWLGSRVAPQHFGPRAAHGPKAGKKAAVVDALLDEQVPEHARPSLARAARTTLTCLLLWFGPIAALALLLGRGHVFVQVGLFFSKAAVVTFGGAYAVLAYIAQRLVEGFGWLTAGEMLDGLGLAETTPGPLILVTQFSGFLAAARHVPELPPLLAGLAGAALTTWVTFVPCFLWIFVGAPWIEALRGQRALNGALAGITAAVVGVVLNLSLWFALHVLFGAVAERHVGPLRLQVPDLATLDWPSLVLAAAAAVATFRYRVRMLPVLGACALAGAAWTLLAATNG
ncbi:MAG: chromate efflux transporter [Planctomycetes bacterium]|nr:chromate efflux transporter [Planctomycetota bacterium]